MDAQCEKEYIEAVLRRTQGGVSRAAQLLDLQRRGSRGRSRETSARGGVSLLAAMSGQIKVHAAGQGGPHAKLAYGQFFGRFDREVDAGGFSLAHIHADPRTDVQRHTHDAAHFIFVTRGVYVTSAAGPSSVWTSPVVIYNPPGTTHRDRFQRGPDGGFDGRFLSISIAPERIEGVTLAERSISVGTAQATALAARLIAELRQWDSASPLVAEGVCLELAACVARREAFGERTPPRWLAIARDMLRSGDERLSVAEIAAACGVHPVHLARTFRRFFGCSPGTYLRRARVERAAALLRQARLTLADVALRSGFADQSHMTHAFHAVLGITPAAYRRLHSDNCVSMAQDDPADSE